jgi:hypothetical protein
MRVFAGIWILELVNLDEVICILHAVLDNSNRTHNVILLFGAFNLIENASAICRLWNLVSLFRLFGISLAAATK